MKIFKYLLVFLAGITVGVFGYEFFVGDRHQEKIAEIVTEYQIIQVENFLSAVKMNDEARYCKNYYIARDNAHVLNQKLFAVENGMASNRLLLGNKENVKVVLQDFKSFEAGDIKYECENT